MHTEPAPGAVLVHAFTGFLDAASAVRIAAQHLVGSGEHRLIASFDADELIDYRARRPTLTFVGDHFAAVDAPSITLYEVLDAAGTPYLVLSGPEPDYQWNSFVNAIAWLIERFDIGLVVGLSAIPWPVPHTRPLGSTWHGNDPAMLVGRPPVVGTIEVPGHISGMLELGLGESGHPVLGIAAHVPHYLAQFEYPQVAITLVDELCEATGLVLPTDGLRASADRARGEVDAQVDGSAEVQSVVAALEQQYDTAELQQSMAERVESDLLDDGEVPSGDEIAAQVEQFLADMRQGEGEDD